MNAIYGSSEYRQRHRVPTYCDSVKNLPSILVVVWKKKSCIDFLIKFLGCKVRFIHPIYHKTKGVVLAVCASCVLSVIFMI